MINSRDDIDWTPLLLGMGNGKQAAAAATWLIEHGADVGAVSNMGRTIFAKVCYYMTPSSSSTSLPSCRSSTSPKPATMATLR